VLLSSNHQSRQYSNIILDEGSPINKDMVFSNDRKHLYVMTEYKVNINNTTAGLEMNLLTPF
jgi:hypothetical protein